MILFDKRFYELWPEARPPRREDQAVWDELSERERAIVALCALGWTDRQIGAVVGLQPWTVHRRLSKIRKAFGAESKHELIERLAGWDWSEWQKQYPR
jgi:DNA-binding NarL/FixJ family response regulator